VRRFAARLLRWLGKGALAGLALLGLYLLAAWGLARVPVAKEPGGGTEVAIFILTNGVHTDIVVPTVDSLIDWRGQINPAHVRRPDPTAAYLAFGWGDKGFYLQTPTWADLRASVAFNAAFGLGGAAMHATYYRAMPESATCRRIWLSRPQYARLVAYLQASLQKDQHGNAILIPTQANYGPTDAFYEATGSYSLFHTCNTWANNALKACGQKCCLWTPFDTGIFLNYAPD
jgi:uncharacterized protein (TIGR02117 family)